MGARLIQIVRLLLGVVYFVNGFNWWFKIISPYPSMSDFVHFAPPPDVVGAMINTSILFDMVKATELLTGIALLTNRFVPLMLVAALPVTLPIFVVDAFTNVHLRGVVMGTGSLLLNIFLLLAYVRHYRTMLDARGVASLDPAAGQAHGDGALVHLIARVARPLMLPFGLIAAAWGCVMVAWLGTMIVQYAIHPLPLSALHHLTPR